MEGEMIEEGTLRRTVECSHLPEVDKSTLGATAGGHNGLSIKESVREGKRLHRMEEYRICT